MPTRAQVRPFPAEQRRPGAGLAIFLDMALLDQSPHFPIDEAQRFLAENFSLDGELERLHSERDQNFAVSCESGEFVLKIANGQEERGLLEAQIELFEYLARTGAATEGICPRPVPGRDGRMIQTVRGTDGTVHLTWVITRLDGVPMGEVAGVGSELRRELGLRVAELDRELEGFDHQACHRELVWDLARGRQVVADRVSMLDVEMRGWVEVLMERFDRYTAPRLPKLRRAVIHGDVNDYNVLVTPDGGSITGLIDFGDMVYSYRVGDLAIAAAYALLDQAEPLDALEEVVEGYAQSLPLDEHEIEALWGLVCLRVCVSGVLAADHAREYENTDYLEISQRPIRHALPRLVERPLEMATAVVRGACDPGRGRVSGTRAPSDSKEVAERRSRFVGPSLKLSYGRPVHFERGWMQYLFTPEGRRFLDAYNNVPHVGHSHPAVVEAATRQLRRLNTNTRYHYRALGEYAERLAATLPAGLDVCFLLSSASEANELALRLARAARGARDVVVMEGAYHGNTSTLVDASPYKHDGPGGGGAPDWVHRVPQPDLYRGAYRAEDPEAAQKYVRDAEGVVERAAAEGRRMSAFLAETCPSVGGQHVLPAGYLTGVYKAMRAAGALCIADEVQTGLWRLGDVAYAFEEHGVVPDVVVLGKPIGNGYPLAAVVTTREIAEAFDNGMEFFATFGGNSVACEVGLAVLDVLESEGLAERARRVGTTLLAGLRELQDRFDVIGDVRGRGFFLGVELVEDRESRAPATQVASRVKNGLREAGVLIGTDGLDDNVLKIRPPMCFDAENAGLLLEQLEQELSAC